MPDLVYLETSIISYLTGQARRPTPPLDKNRPMTTISIRFPEDVIDDLKRVAPLRGFSGYQPLVRAYVGQGLRVDMERLENDTVGAFVESLKKHGVSEEVITEALNEASHR